MIRIVSIIVATLLFCYIVFVSFFFRESRQKELCRDLQVVVVDSLDKHFVSESDLVHILKKADLNPIKRPMDEINTDRIENELLKNQNSQPERPDRCGKLKALPPGVSAFFVG